jgi:carbonic anhydrase
MTQLLSIALLFAVAAADTNHSGPALLPFTYETNAVDGPESWRFVNTTDNEWEKYRGLDHINLDVPGNECKSTRRPSPINLVANSECLDSHEILTRKKKPTDCKMDSLEFSVTPHTLRADFPNSDTYCQRPTIDLPNGYPSIWYVHHIEVHLRSEHVLDGRRYDGEMQMYHLGTEDQKRELSAVSILFDASGLRDEPRLQEYIDHWEAIAKETNDVCDGTLDRRNLRNPNREPPPREPLEFSEFNLADLQIDLEEEMAEARKHSQQRRHLQGEEELAPRDKMFPYEIWPTIHFYRYKGMITSPPCSEIVSWRVMDEPLVISRRQLRRMAKLLADYRDPTTCEQQATRTSETGENARPLQDLNHEKQELVHCTSKDFTHRLYPPSMV